MKFLSQNCFSLKQFSNFVRPIKIRHYLQWIHFFPFSPTITKTVLSVLSFCIFLINRLPEERIEEGLPKCWSRTTWNMLGHSTKPKTSYILIESIQTDQKIIAARPWKQIKRKNVSLATNRKTLVAKDQQNVMTGTLSNGIKNIRQNVTKSTSYCEGPMFWDEDTTQSWVQCTALATRLSGYFDDEDPGHPPVISHKTLYPSTYSANYRDVR